MSHSHCCAVPRDPKTLFQNGSLRVSKPRKVEDIFVPHSRLVQEASDYLKSELPAEIWNHSLRVYLVGADIAEQHFPDISFDHEAYYLASVFHDLGCTPSNLKATVMSFEFYGGILAREWLLQHSAPQGLADRVAEAIFRHTNFVPGMIEFLGQVIQLATLTDVIGANPELGDEPGLNTRLTIDSIVEAYPRLGWDEYFSSAMSQEMKLKPWSMTTALQEENNFTEKIEKNPLMARYDGR